MTLPLHPLYPLHPLHPLPLPGRLSCVIFDIDGTLIDSRDQHVYAWAQAFREHGLELDEAAVQAQMGRRKPQIARALGGPGLSDEEIDAIVSRKMEIFDAQAHSLLPIPGAADAVRLTAEAGLKVVLATSATRAEADSHVDLLGIAGVAAAVLSQEDVVHSKPDPEIILKALAAADCAPDEAIMVGDSPHDMRAGVRAGVASVAVRTGGFEEVALMQAGASVILASVADLSAIVLD